MYNPTQKSERQLKKDKEKLENQKVFLETKNEIKQYLAWQELPSQEKAKIRKEWDNYYLKVKNTKSCKEFFELKKHWPRNVQSPRFKELVNKAKQRLENEDFELSKPQGVDPWEFYHGLCYKYNNICYQINQINKQLTGVEDVEDIFEKPKKKTYKQPYLD